MWAGFTGVRGGQRVTTGEFDDFSYRRHSARLPIPAGILRIPVFSVHVALFSQESRFLFRRNFFLPPQKSCLYGANVGCYVGNEFVKKNISNLRYVWWAA